MRTRERVVVHSRKSAMYEDSQIHRERMRVYSEIGARCTFKKENKGFGEKCGERKKKEERISASARTTRTRQPAAWQKIIITSREARFRDIKT